MNQLLSSFFERKPPSSSSSSHTEQDEIDSSCSDPDLVYEDDQFQIRLYSNRDTVLKEQFSNWSRNRPADESRVSDIVEYYQLQHRQMVDGMIYVWNHENRYWIYDGIHRFEAVLQVSHEMCMMVCHVITKREEDIIQHFITLNKSIHVPTLYLDMTENHYKKNVCESVAKNLCYDYPNFVSQSRNPNTYNFNRDQLIEFLSTLSIDFQKPNVIPHIMEHLKELNRFSEKIHEKRRDLPNKCHRYQFYLFLLPKEHIKKYLETNLL